MWHFALTIILASHAIHIMPSTSRRGTQHFSQHIDIHVRQILEIGRGGNTIQGSISLGEELELS